MKILNKIYNLVTLIIFLLIMGVALLFVSTLFPIPGGIHTYTVLSGSMEPTIHTGSIIMVKEAEDYNVNDIVTRKLTNTKTVTHRIVQKFERENTTTLYRTRGDANTDIDDGEYSKHMIVGKVFFTLPHAGYISSYARTPFGFFLLIALPATLLIAYEIRNILQRTKETHPDQKK